MKQKERFRENFQNPPALAVGSFNEGQEAKNHMNADAGFAVAYLSSLIANIMSNSKLEGSPEETAENIKNTILEYYKNIKKES